MHIELIIYVCVYILLKIKNMFKIAISKSHDSQKVTFMPE